MFTHLKSLLRLACLIPVLALAQTAPTLKLSWQAVTSMSDGSPLPPGATVSYNVYGGHALTGPFSLAGNVTTLANVRTNVAVGLDCYQVTAVVNAVESVATPAVCVTVTASVSPVPATPLNLLITQTQ
jgi:hypothetical protein